MPELLVVLMLLFNKRLFDIICSFYKAMFVIAKYILDNKIYIYYFEHGK